METSPIFYSRLCGFCPVVFGPEHNNSGCSQKRRFLVTSINVTDCTISIQQPLTGFLYLRLFDLCSFVGQFTRHTALDRHLMDIFGESNIVEFDAFVSTSTQHDEESPHDLINATGICNNLKKGGFRNCQVDAQIYDKQVYMKATLKREFQLKNKLFPVRNRK